MQSGSRWLVAALAGSGVAVAARRRNALSTSGAIGAAGVGAAVFGATGWRGSALLLLFFGSSTALSRLPHHTGQDAPDGPRRTLAQVLANGGIPAMLALTYANAGSPRALAAFDGALAAANADTWSTEIGRRSRAVPRMITSGQRVVPGISGAVTGLGTLAALGGAFVIGIAGAALLPRERKRSFVGTVARLTVAGFAGALADSVLGATAQAVYRCRRCGLRIEDHRHAHGDAAPDLVLIRGVPFMTNDAVNLCASATGAAVMLCFGVWLRCAM